eukprot:5889988-Pyramimonas_sp.AAC.1
MAGRPRFRRAAASPASRQNSRYFAKTKRNIANQAFSYVSLRCSTVSSGFPAFPNVSHRFPMVSGCDSVSLRVCRCLGMSFDVFGCPWMSAKCPCDVSGMSLDVLGCPSDVLGCPWMSLECPWMSLDVLG